MTHSQGEMEADAAAQYEVEYPEKLKKLFEEDSSDQSYDLPFEHPEDLHKHFTDLEEENLGLIVQWQDNEEQTEVRRQEFERIQYEKTREMHNLEATVKENMERRGRIGEEKNVLEMQTSKGSENLMTQDQYEQVTKLISEIRVLVDKNRAKGTNQPEPTQQLVEIETHINHILKFISNANKVEKSTVTAKMKVLAIKFKEEKFAAQREKERIEREQQNQLLKERRDNHVHV